MLAAGKKKSRSFSFVIFTCLLALSGVFLTVFLMILLQYKENKRFLACTDQMFREQVCASTLNLHYTLAVPTDARIDAYPITFGHPASVNEHDSLIWCENQDALLDSFHEKLLTKDNRIVLALLRESCDASASCPKAVWMQEPLSPSLGIQAQLPVLLAEYTFRTKQDVMDYLKLLQTLPEYFQELLSFEQQKASRGLFMNDLAAKGVIAQCQTFMEEAAGKTKDNYLQKCFTTKIYELSSLSDTERTACIHMHERLVQNRVIPAYRSLADGLQELLGSGRHTGGLALYPDGAAYYQYLLRTQVGTCDTPADIRNRLLVQLQADTLEAQEILKKHPDYLREHAQEEVFLPLKNSAQISDSVQASGSVPVAYSTRLPDWTPSLTSLQLPDLAPSSTSLQLSEYSGVAASAAVDESRHLPETILSTLQDDIQQDFPHLASTDYDVKYVDESLQEHSSPAFYLTPPVDTNTPNSIYINPSAHMDSLELYTTLAHEGFPGHLYQTVYFARTNPPLIRSLYTPSGYVEGWATYVESYAYEYACRSSLVGDTELVPGSLSNNDRISNDSSLSDANTLSDQLAYGRLQWLNRSMGLCLYSLLDLGIHNDGWSLKTATALLARFGVTDALACADIYEYIVENPANYLKYYYGYLNFCDLKTRQMQKLGKDFYLKDFHQRLLELGPMPFDLLEKYM